MKEAIGHKCNAILNVLIFNMKEIESQVSIKDNMIRLRKRFKVRKKTKITDDSRLTIIALG